MKKEFFMLVKINDNENVYQLKTSKGKEYLFKSILSVEEFMCKKYPQFTGSIRALLINLQHIFWNVIDGGLYYSNYFNVKNPMDVKGWKKVCSTKNQTKDYINIMKSFNLDYNDDEEINIKQDFLENLKNIENLLK